MREDGLDEHPAERKNHEQISQQVAEAAVGPPGLSARVDPLAVRQEALLRHFVRAHDDQLHDEDEQKDRRGLKEQPEIHAASITRPQPRDPRRAKHAGSRSDDQMHGLSDLQKEQRRLDALAAHHQQREEEDTDERRGAGPDARRVQPHFDVALHAPARAPHVDDHPRDRHGRNQGERPFEPFLVGGVIQQVAAEDADGERDGDAPVHGGCQGDAPRLAQVRQADGDDEKGFEAFPKSDDERLEHDWSRPVNETQSQDEKPVYLLISDRSSRGWDGGVNTR